MEFKEGFDKFCQLLACIQLVQKGGPNSSKVPLPRELQVLILGHVLGDVLGHRSKQLSGGIFESLFFNKLRQDNIIDNKKKLDFLLAQFSNERYTEVPDWFPPSSAQKRCHT